MSDHRQYPFERLPKVTRDEVTAIERMLRRVPPGVVTLADVDRLIPELEVEARFGALEVSYVTPGMLTSALDPEIAVVTLAYGGELPPRTVALEVDRALAGFLVDRVLGGDGYGIAPRGALGDEELGVLVYVVARLAQLAGARVVSVARGAAPLATLARGHALLALGQRCTLRSRTDRESAAKRSGWAKAFVTGHLRLWWSEDALLRAPLAPLATPSLDLEMARVDGAITIAEGRLAADELARGLRVGDVLVVDAPWIDRPTPGGPLTGRAELRFGPASYVGVLDAEVFTITERRVSHAGVAHVEDPMTETAKPPEARPADVRAASLPVTVSIELARVTMTIAELASLTPGQVIRTGALLGERVRVRVGDRVVADGELVDVEGELGVRIVDAGA